MTPAPEETLWTLLTEAKHDAMIASRPYGKRESLAVIKAFLGEFAKQIRKDKKKGAILPEAEQVYAIYPRREGGSAALAAISACIQKDGFELVFSKTKEYAEAVKGWPRLYRYSQGKNGEPARDLVPMATTWFNQQRYKDDASNWVRIGGKPAPAPYVAPVHITDEELSRRGSQARAEWASSPEPAKDTLQHAIWLAAQSFTATPNEVETEDRLRRA